MDLERRLKQYLVAGQGQAYVEATGVQELLRTVRTRLVQGRGNVDMERATFRRELEEEAWRYLDEASRTTFSHLMLSSEEKAELFQRLMQSMFGFGPLDELLARQDLTEIMVNGPARVFFERGNRVSIAVDSKGRPVRFVDEQELRSVINKVVQAVTSAVGKAASSLKDKGMDIVKYPFSLAEAVKKSDPWKAIAGPVEAALKKTAENGSAIGKTLYTVVQNNAEAKAAKAIIETPGKVVDWVNQKLFGQSAPTATSTTSTTVKSTQMTTSAKPSPVSTWKPSTVSTAKPTPAPTTKPAPAPVSKPVLAPVAKPAPTPAPKPVEAPVAKPAPAPAPKLVPVPAAKTSPAASWKPASTARPSAATPAAKAVRAR